MNAAVSIQGGEVYFEVAKNASKPFRVQVNDRSTIEVLGTNLQRECLCGESPSSAPQCWKESKESNRGKNAVLLKPGAKWPVHQYKRNRLPSFAYKLPIQKQ